MSRGIKYVREGYAEGGRIPVYGREGDIAYYIDAPPETTSQSQPIASFASPATRGTLTMPEAPAGVYAGHYVPGRPDRAFSPFGFADYARGSQANPFAQLAGLRSPEFIPIQSTRGRGYESIYGANLPENRFDVTVSADPGVSVTPLTTEEKVNYLRQIAAAMAPVTNVSNVAYGGAGGTGGAGGSTGPVTATGGRSSATGGTGGAGGSTGPVTATGGTSSATGGAGGAGGSTGPVTATGGTGGSTGPVTATGGTSSATGGTSSATGGAGGTSSVGNVSGGTSSVGNVSGGSSSSTVGNVAGGSATLGDIVNTAAGGTSTATGTGGTSTATGTGGTSTATGTGTGGSSTATGTGTGGTSTATGTGTAGGTSTATGTGTGTGTGAGTGTTAGSTATLSQIAGTGPAGETLISEVDNRNGTVTRVYRNNRTGNTRMATERAPAPATSAPVQGTGTGGGLASALGSQTGTGTGTATPTAGTGPAGGTTTAPNEIVLSEVRNSTTGALVRDIYNPNTGARRTEVIPATPAPVQGTGTGGGLADALGSQTGGTGRPTDPGDATGLGAGREPVTSGELTPDEATLRAYDQIRREQELPLNLGTALSPIETVPSTVLDGLNLPSPDELDRRASAQLSAPPTPDFEAYAGDLERQQRDAEERNAQFSRDWYEGRIPGSPYQDNKDEEALRNLEDVLRSTPAAQLPGDEILAGGSGEEGLTGTSSQAVSPADRIAQDVMGRIGAMDPSVAANMGVRGEYDPNAPNASALQGLAAAIGAAAPFSGVGIMGAGIPVVGGTLGLIGSGVMDQLGLNRPSSPALSAALNPIGTAAGALLGEEGRKAVDAQFTRETAEMARSYADQVLSGNMSPSMAATAAVQDLGSVGRIGAVLDAIDQAAQIQGAQSGEMESPGGYDGGAFSSAGGLGFEGEGAGGNWARGGHINMGHLVDHIKRQVRKDLARGGYVPGHSGGMDDDVPAVIDGRRPARLSSGEFVFDAATVAALGDGNNAAGAKKLNQLRHAIRQKAYGHRRQPPKNYSLGDLVGMA